MLKQVIALGRAEKAREKDEREKEAYNNNKLAVEVPPDNQGMANRGNASPATPRALSKRPRSPEAQGAAAGEPPKGAADSAAAVDPTVAADESDAFFAACADDAALMALMDDVEKGRT